MSIDKGFVNPIEGYLSTKERFNGVLFILREPNTDDQDSFWFKNCFLEPPKDSLSKRTFTKFKTAFEILLSYCVIGDNLRDSAFANIRAHNGKNQTSKEYRKLTAIDKVNRIDSLITECEPKFIFVCNDMFDAIATVKNINYSIDGIKYKKKQMRRLELDGNITVFEMYHPSAPVSYPLCR